MYTPYWKIDLAKYEFVIQVACQDKKLGWTHNGHAPQKMTRKSLTVLNPPPGLLSKHTMRVSPPLLVLLAYLPAVFFVSCSGSELRKAKEHLLTKSPWKYEKAGFDSNQDGYIDALDPRIADCGRDDIILFNADGTGSFNTGSITCDPSDPPSLPFTWSFENEDKGIYFQGQHFTIKTLSADRLEMYSYQVVGNTRTRYLILLKH
jgi:hypothetical protein